MSKIQTYKIMEIIPLSIMEYERYKPVIPYIDADWWLRSPGQFSFIAASVNRTGTVDAYGSSVYYSFIGVRPALRLNISDSSNFQPGDKVQLLNLDWTVLDVSENQIYVLTNDIVAKRRFDLTSNSWESSELKAWLENWLSKTLAKNNYDTDTIKNTIVLTTHKDSSLSTKLNTENEAEGDLDLE